MKRIKIILSFFCLATIAALQVKAQKRKDYPIVPVPFTHVHINDKFWAPKLMVNAKVTIPYIFRMCKENGRMNNFLLAAHTVTGGKLTQFTFDDTDVYKAIEGASYALQVERDFKLEMYIDSLISMIANAQEKDGYLYTFRTANIKPLHEWVGAKRWEKEEELSHELYNSGHLFEAAVAHYEATGKRNFLNIAIKNADLLATVFGPGKLQIYPGHQIVEIGLVKLYRVTGNQKYLDLAKFFLDVRGPNGDQYNQAHAKVVDQKTAVGHAVRATYMYTGMADVAALTGDAAYLNAIDNIWEDVVGKKLYITGGIGATGNGEAFGDAYQLPNMSAYAETCAAIANIYWNSRMFQLHGDSKYIDILERTLYNGLLSGVSLSGDRFFYPNPLASMHQHQRSGWFACACCISNMTRFLPSLPGYVYAHDGNNLYVNLFMANKADIKLNSTEVNVTQFTEYPWKGNIKIAINPVKSATFKVHLRIPGWATNTPVPGDLYSYLKAKDAPFKLLLNGKPINYQLVKGYAVIERRWQKDDQITLELPMDIHKVVANQKVKDDIGRFAFQKGPIVYCLEGPDNKDGQVQNIMVSKDANPNAYMNNAKLNGIEEILVDGIGTKRQVNTDELIQTNQKVVAIPYYAWANRGSSDMAVWIPYEVSAARPQAAPTIASKSKVSSSLNNPKLLQSINDQYEPADSKDTNYPYLHWWPKKNSTEFVQYDFANEETISQSNVYWYDDGPWGGCRIPLSYKIFYLKGEKWIPVEVINDTRIAKDKFNIVDFKPVSAKGIKLEIQLPVEQSSGIHEWKIK
ncbi:glycoside hydrolase family 127 protein [Pedobacter sp. LMG 31464]|uniref:Glycoside hydrolase family 127 protein n=1 Tax=Pedobacter planticolens TaxID=2679964 RepID=A0A923DXI3_9SPHI|nr:glycoside hydrolase family 127 protein [Pedobacter planticolens]MBB2144881.1 glycoside hydrolase family 127 protein [Pedobacter planticolens]